MIPVIVLCVRWQWRFSTNAHQYTELNASTTSLIGDIKQVLMVVTAAYFVAREGYFPQSRPFVLICLGSAAFNFVAGGLAVHGPTILRESLQASQAVATLGLGLATVFTGRPSV